MQSVILATMTDMQNSNPSWVQGSLPGARFDWENVETGFGIACPPVGHFLILAPLSGCAGEDWRDRLLKFDDGEPLRFYSLIAAMEVADHIAAAWERDRADAEFWRSEARRIEDGD